MFTSDRWMTKTEKDLQQELKYLIFEFSQKGMKVVTTLDIPNRPGRRVGNTTRQVDFAIDNLFQGHVVVCYDHHEAGGNRRANQDLLKRVVLRLQHDHKVLAKYMIYDKNHRHIYLKYT